MRSTQRTASQPSVASKQISRVKYFASQQELTDLAAKWPAKRLVEVWNGIPGLTPVKKFKDQKSAVARIWTAIQSLDGGSPAETPAQPATAKTAAIAVRKPAKKDKHAAKAKP